MPYGRKDTARLARNEAMARSQGFPDYVTMLAWDRHQQRRRAAPVQPRPVAPARPRHNVLEALRGNR